MPADRMESFLEDKSYYLTLEEDAQLLRRVAEKRGDVHVVAMLDAFLLHFHAITAVTLAYWRHGQSAHRNDIAWALGLGEDARTLDAFLAEFGFTDADLHQKSLQELVHRDRITVTLASAIETSRENYTVFLQCLSASAAP